MRRIARAPLPAFLAAGIGVVLVTGACGDESASPDGSGGLSAGGGSASVSGGKSSKGGQAGTPSLGGSAPDRGGTSGGTTPVSQGGKATGGR